MKNLFSQFYDYLKNQKRYSENTIKNYKLDLDKFHAFLVESRINNLTAVKENDVLNYLQVISSKNQLCGVTINRKLSSIRHFFKYLKKYHKIVNNEIFFIKNNSQKSDNPTAISQEKMQKILKYLKKEAEKSWENQQQYALFLLIYAMGLRISEALSLKVEDFENNYIIIQGKGNKQRKVPILESVKREVQKTYNQRKNRTMDIKSPAFLSTRNDKPLNPRYTQRFIEKIRKLFDLDEHFTPHTIRHCFATHLLQNGVQINDLKTLLGHQNISTTQRYLHVDIQKIVNEHAINHPLEK
jgi:integrase/recombinase XerC